MASRAAAMAQAASASSFLGRSQSGGAASTSSSTYDSSPPVRLHGFRPSSLSSRKSSFATKLEVAQQPPVDTSRRKAGPRASAVLPHWTDPRASFPSIPVQDTTSAPSPRFDKWLTQAAGEIVRHLEEAPFLHYVFDGITKEGSPQFQQVSAGEAAGWENIQSQVQAVSPDGVILVQRLGVEAAAKCYGEEYAETSAVESCAKIESCPYATGLRTDVWGLVVQGRRNSKHACYILKTTRAVGCSHACTRFSLTRATCFGPSLHKQLENSWLVS